MILAAGMATRYGGLKQLEPVGPNGEAILDLNIADARAAGFGDVVLVIREELEPAFRDHAAGLPGAGQRTYTYQQVPKGRSKPWGTGAAVLAAEAVAPDRFAVANADDLYGREAFTTLAEHLAASEDWAVVGYAVRSTLSAVGGVSRAVCEVGSDQLLRGLRELYEVREQDARITARNAAGVELELGGDALVSMNLWGFTRDVFPLLAEAFDRFRAAGGELEFLLSDAVGDFVQEGHARVRVLRASGGWAGVTYPADLDAVRERVAARTDSRER